MGAIAGKAGITARAPNFRADPFGRTRLDHPGVIPPGNARQRRLSHGPGDILDITWIDRGGHDPDECNPFVFCRRGHLHHLENRGIPEGLKSHRTHGLLLSVANYEEDECYPMLSATLSRFCST